MSRQCPYCGQRMGMFQTATGPMAELFSLKALKEKAQPKKKRKVRRTDSASGK